MHPDWSKGICLFPDSKNLGCCGNKLTGELKIKVAHFQITVFFFFFFTQKSTHWQESPAGIFIINKLVVCCRIISQNLHVKKKNKCTFDFHVILNYETLQCPILNKNFLLLSLLPYLPSSFLPPCVPSSLPPFLPLSHFNWDGRDLGVYRRRGRDSERNSSKAFAKSRAWLLGLEKIVICS